MIDIRNLSFDRPQKNILKQFNCQFHAKKLTLLSGANGSGKSTLINLVGGVLKPSSGSITINGIDIKNLSSREQSTLRSIAPQRRIFDLAFTVSETLAIIAKDQRAPHQTDVEKALEIGEIADLRVTELSLGQQQRVSVALALIQDAPFYLLDEPLSAQDSSHKTATLDLLAHISKERGVIVVAHDADGYKARFDGVINL